jgi:hypothetical protein
LIILIFWSERCACAALMRFSRNVVFTIFGIIGTSKVCALPMGVTEECIIHYFWVYFGQIEVKGLPLGIAAESSVHYFWDYFSTFFLLSG